MQRSIPAFSKKSSSGPTIGGGGHRSGFLEHVKSTNAGKTPQTGGIIKGGKIGGAPKSPRTPAPTPRASGKAARSVPAFSKKTI